MQVSVDATGKVTKTLLTKKSDYPSIDEAAERAARSSTYEPAAKDCTPVAGTYVFRVTFNRE